MTDTCDDRGRSQAQAIAQFQSIAEMVAALRAAEEAVELTIRGHAYDARTHIQEDALSVEVRSGWYVPGARDADTKPAEYTILLCTGGPAVRIIGELNGHGEPDTARLEHQDWFRPWVEISPLELATSQLAPITTYSADQAMELCDKVTETLLTYARQFYFGEG